MFTEKSSHIKVNGQETEVYHVVPLCPERGITSILQEKLIPREELEDYGKQLKNRGTTINFTTGTFDLIHPGHVRYLFIASLMGDPLKPKKLFVGLNSDLSVKTYKDPDRPILDQLTRAEMLAALGFVSFITIYDETNGAEVINLLKPDNYLCVEGSWTGDLAAKAEVQAMVNCDGRIHVSPRQGPQISTSAIIEKIASGQKAKQIASEVFRHHVVNQ